ncbi:MAG: hypothetical protein LPK88_11720, partial [Alphaproteobacteria bacterium]|nr:hypothetical protein [Alphaproteobacteria bacterium]MDX5416966.1 hypothetical protein [Alphaproteobacteria bacterium]MDX5494367.1 hypothetical protein [Alphaproteobacteria bacterium]
MELDFAPNLVSWLGTGIAGGLGAWFGAYLSKKGENLATKEDISAITHLQEGVKHEFQTLIEQMRATASMRMAAVEKRLAAHQEAYSLWLRLFFDVHSERNNERIADCERWWEANNLYLDPTVRLAFKDACRAAHIHSSLLAGDRSPESVRKIKENW